MLLKRTRETIYNNRFTILKNHTRSITNYPPFTNSSSSTSFPFSKRGKGIAKKFLRSLRHVSFRFSIKNTSRFDFVMISRKTGFVTGISKLKRNNGNTDSDLDRKKKRFACALFFSFARPMQIRRENGGCEEGGRIGPRVTACPRMTDHASAVE